MNALDLFEIGYSWAGDYRLGLDLQPESPPWRLAYRLVRLSFGMEDTDDLIAELKQALAHMQAAQ